LGGDILELLVPPRAPRAPTPPLAGAQGEVQLLEQAMHRAVPDWVAFRPEPVSELPRTHTYPGLLAHGVSRDLVREQSFQVADQGGVLVFPELASPLPPRGDMGAPCLPSEFTPSGSDAAAASGDYSVRRAKARFFSGCNSHPATFAPAGSNRSGSGGNEAAEAFDGEGRLG